ncbi:aspartyl protease family protein [Dyella mobilis]|nr:aspartyl protease family protein [Dyella mobilis]
MSEVLMICKVSCLGLALALVGVVPMRAHAETAAPTPQSLFAAMKAASGGVRWDGAGELEQRFAIEQGGQTGTCTQYQDLHSGRNASYCSLGEVPNAQGYDGANAWFMDEKSMVSLRQSVQANHESATDAYLARNGWFQPASTDPAQMRYVGQQKEAGGIYDVVQVIPKGGMAFDAWIDARSHLLERVVEDTDDGGKQITWYSDYQPVDGVLIAYTQRQGNGDAQYDTSMRLQHVSLHATADDAHFAIPSSHVHDAHIEGGASSATVPFTSYAGLILVQISINGGKPLPFILDTGGLNLLTPEAAHRLGLAGAGHQAIGGVGADTQSMQTARVKSYRVGDVVMQDQQFLIVDLPRLLTDRGAREPIAGIIGYELLRRFATRIDYDRNLLTLTPVSAFRGVTSASAVPIVFDDRTPQLVARVNGAPGTFNLDTGDASELTVFEPFAKAHGIKPSGNTMASQARGAGGKISLTAAHVDSLSIGPFTVVRPLTAFTAPAKGGFASTLLAGNIGHGILSRFIVTLDYEHRQLYLQQGQHFAQESPHSRTGVGLDRTEHDALAVATIAPGSPGHQVGLRVGDRVVALDGVPVAQMGLDDIQRVMQQPDGTHLPISVVRQGKVGVYTLILRDPLQ